MASVFQDRVNDCKRELLREALWRAKGHRGRAAALLGIHRSSFYVLIRQLGVPLPARPAPPPRPKTVKGIFDAAERNIRVRHRAEAR